MDKESFVSERMDSVSKVNFDDKNDVDRNFKDCYNGCKKYNKTMDEIVQAVSKDREPALALKSIRFNQKTKLN